MFSANLKLSRTRRIRLEIFLILMVSVRIQGVFCDRFQGGFGIFLAAKSVSLTFFTANK